ncbi:hypothetical protein Cni_G28755 [Canna indica]|uniref:Uncharacterized protein n=1 Tax=Canna indica TaxID=4628 RepID=A0AAQ3L3A3_9LILI|nr:hypothetical protein Cni_G28755 [Canna indica]
MGRRSGRGSRRGEREFAEGAAAVADAGEGGGEEGGGGEEEERGIDEAAGGRLAQAVGVPAVGEAAGRGDFVAAKEGVNRAAEGRIRRWRRRCRHGGGVVLHVGLVHRHCWGGICRKTIRVLIFVALFFFRFIGLI